MFLTLLDKHWEILYILDIYLYKDVRKERLGQIRWHTHHSENSGGRGRQADLCEFKSKTARAVTERNPVSKTKQNKTEKENQGEN